MIEINFAFAKVWRF